MRHFIDLGTHRFGGLTEFIKILNLGKNDNVYCYEANTDIYTKTIDRNSYYSEKFNSFSHYNFAVMDYTGKISFNSHRGAWMNSDKKNYNNHYDTGSNCLDINPKYDPGNGVIFDIVKVETDCIDIEEILSSIVNDDENAEIIIKCDIEGSEFCVLPKILNS